MANTPSINRGVQLKQCTKNGCSALLLREARFRIEETHLHHEVDT